MATIRPASTAVTLPQTTIDTYEDRLSHLAVLVRGARYEQRTADEHAAADEYCRIVAYLKPFGWQGDGLPADALLPEELMPNLFE